MRPSAAPAGTEYVSRRIEGHGVTMAKNLAAWQLAREPVAAPVDVVWIVEHLDGDRADRGVIPKSDVESLEKPAERWLKPATPDNTVRSRPGRSRPAVSGGGTLPSTF